MTNPKISPAARAVLDAADNQPFKNPDGDLNLEGAIAAALRAAAAHLPRSAMYPSCDWGSGWRDGIGDAEKKLLAIAAELDPITTTETTDD